MRASGRKLFLPPTSSAPFFAFAGSLLKGKLHTPRFQTRYECFGDAWALEQDADLAAAALATIDAGRQEIETGYQQKVAPGKEFRVHIIFGGMKCDCACREFGAFGGGRFSAKVGKNFRIE